MLHPGGGGFLVLQTAEQRYGAEHAPPAATTKAAPAAMPSLIGNWTGKVKATAFFITKKLSFSMHITDQTDNSVTGSVTVQGKTYNGTIPVTWSGRDFTLSYSNDKVNGKLNGTVNEADNQITGTFKGIAYGISGKGTVKLDKVA